VDKKGDCKGGVCLHHVSVPTDLRDRVMDWQEELLRIAPRLFDLPAAARQAVYETVSGFLREDAELVESPRLVRAA
jgi:hypothetical protein